MNKGLIITGPENSGKTMLAKWIAGVSGKENTVWVDGFEPNLIRAINSQISDHPDGALIIIDQLKYLDQIEMLLSIPTDGFFVLPKGKPAFHIPAEKLRIIITVQHRLENTEILHSQSVLRRFEIIDTATCGYAFEDKAAPKFQGMTVQKVINQWASEYFSDEKGKLGRLVPFNQPLYDFLFHYPELKMTPSRFRRCLKEYCTEAGLIFNPQNPESKLSVINERIIKRWPKGIYDPHTNSWLYLADEKTPTSLILIKNDTSE